MTGSVSSEASVSAPAGRAVRSLELTDVSVSFGGTHALDSVSVSLGAGETLGLIGPNGAGKTTLLDVVAGSRRPQRGDVYLLGAKLTSRSPMQRARAGLGRTFQQLSLFDGMTVREHVVMGYLAGAPGRRSGLRAVSSRSRAIRFANDDDSPLAPRSLMRRLGLDAMADEMAGEQSVGVARMVDLARALAGAPRVLLLDEPVSGLSEIEARGVGEVLLSLRAEHDLSIVVVEHNLEFARLVSDRIVALDFGKVIAEGEPNATLASPELRRAYFGVSDAESTSPGDSKQDGAESVSVSGAAPKGQP